MADSGVFGSTRCRAGSVRRSSKRRSCCAIEFGNPPADPQARLAHDGLLEVLDPARRTVRLQKEMSEATRKASLTPKTERRGKERRGLDRRKVNLGPPPGMRTPQGRPPAGSDRTGTATAGHPLRNA